MSIFDHAETVVTPPSWRCPHCRTLQPQTTRCWACSRSTVSCVTCHRYRVSVASDLGYCANDVARTPLDGDEVRACWTSTEPVLDAPGLFGELEVSPVAPATPRSAPGPTAVPTDEPDGGPHHGGLIEAPHVEPGRRLMSEVQRRSQGRPGS